MTIFTKSMIILAGLAVSFCSFAATKLNLELKNHTNQVLEIDPDSGQDAVILEQAVAKGGFPSLLGPHARKTLPLEFNDGTKTVISDVLASVTYRIICPNHAGTDLLKISAYLYIIPNPRAMSYGVTVEKSLTGNHCSKLHNGNGVVNIENGQASLLITHL